MHPEGSKQGLTFSPIRPLSHPWAAGGLLSWTRLLAPKRLALHCFQNKSPTCLPAPACPTGGLTTSVPPHCSFPVFRSDLECPFSEAPALTVLFLHSTCHRRGCFVTLVLGSGLRDSRAIAVLLLAAL